MNLDDWKIKEALDALEKKKYIEESLGINLKEISEKFSAISEFSGLSESVKALRSLPQIPKFDFPLQKITLPKLEFDISSIFNKSNLLASKILHQEFGQINSIGKLFLKNDALENFSRQYKSLIQSNLNTAVFITSLKTDELELLKDFKFEIPEFPKINIPKQSLRDLAKILNQDKIWESIEFLRNTYVGNLAILVREAVINSSNNDEAVRKIESLYEEKITSLPHNKFLREFHLNLFVAVIIAVIQIWISFYLSEQSSIELRAISGEISSKIEVVGDRLDKRMEKIEDRLKKIEKDSLDDDNFEENDVYYVVQRTASVKNRPNFNSLTINYLSSDTKIHLLKSKHKWIYIEYIDYLEVVPRYGWVNKKYLKRLEK